ncbi:ribosomal L7Ae/L30e/S12e/Gadd45 family protein [Barrientosiimonas marina]|uniref:Ribosomal L7Ae/L30e/S12e/Gadd45 family protein n=1 Tax=Lentibacillus kimchii TaxID=1542911 RepID=A0ABW2URX9_9BACI
MSYEKVTQSRSHLIIGMKETLKAIKHDTISEVFIADDADKELTREAALLAGESGIPCRRVDSKKKLGAACGIDVDASAVAIKQ